MEFFTQYIVSQGLSTNIFEERLVSQLFHSYFPKAFIEASRIAKNYDKISDRKIEGYSLNISVDGYTAKFTVWESSWDGFAHSSGSNQLGEIALSEADFQLIKLTKIKVAATEFAVKTIKQKQEEQVKQLINEYAVANNVHLETGEWAEVLKDTYYEIADYL